MIDKVVIEGGFLVCECKMGVLLIRGETHIRVNMVTLDQLHHF